MSVTRFIGEFELTIDAKGRVMLPAALKRQMPEAAHDKVVIHRGIEKCLVMYPMNEWNRIANEVNKLNPLIRENREFIRYFFRGATEITLDNTNRFLIPKSLLEYAEIEKDAVLFGYLNLVEIWSKKLYAKQMNEEPKDFSILAEKVGGSLKFGGDVS